MDQMSRRFGERANILATMRASGMRDVQGIREEEIFNAADGLRRLAQVVDRGGERNSLG